MKLTKFGILVIKKTTYLFPSIRDSNISRGCTKSLENPEGRGLYGKSLTWGGGGYGYFLEPHIARNFQTIQARRNGKRTGKTPGK